MNNQVYQHLELAKRKHKEIVKRSRALSMVQNWSYKNRELGADCMIKTVFYMS